MKNKCKLFDENVIIQFTMTYPNLKVVISGYK